MDFSLLGFTCFDDESSTSNSAMFPLGGHVGILVLSDMYIVCVVYIQLCMY
mgnify:CR=1 FL=1